MECFCRKAYKSFIRAPEAVTTEIPWHAGISTSVVNPVSSKTWHGRFNREWVQMRLNVFSQGIFLPNASGCTRERARVINRRGKHCHEPDKSDYTIRPSFEVVVLKLYSCVRLASCLLNQYWDSSPIHWEKVIFFLRLSSHMSCVGYCSMQSSVWCDWLWLSVEWWTESSSASYTDDACGVNPHSRHCLWYVLGFRFWHLGASQLDFQSPRSVASCTGALPLRNDA